MGIGAFILLGLAKIAGSVTVVNVITRKKHIKHMAKKEKSRQVK